MLWQYSNIHQDVLKSGNLLHKRGFGDSQSNTTVTSRCRPAMPSLLSLINKDIFTSSLKDDDDGGTRPSKETSTNDVTSDKQFQISRLDFENKKCKRTKKCSIFALCLFFDQ